MRAVGDYSEVWKGFLERGVTHYSGVRSPSPLAALPRLWLTRPPLQAPTVFVPVPCSPTLCENLPRTWTRSQLSIASHPLARQLQNKVATTVAGAAPTATLIKQLEGLNIDVCHVYGLTGSFLSTPSRVPRS